MSTRLKDDRFKTTEQARKEYLKAYFFDNAMKARNYYTQGEFSKQLNEDLQSNVNTVKEFYNSINTIGDRFSSENYLKDVSYRRQTNEIMRIFLLDLREKTMNGKITPQNYTDILGYAYNTWGVILSELSKNENKEAVKQLQKALKERLTADQTLSMAHEDISLYDQNQQSKRNMTIEELEESEESKKSSKILPKTKSNVPIALPWRNSQLSENQMANHQGTTGEINQFTHNISDKQMENPKYSDLDDHQVSKDRTIAEILRRYQGLKDQSNFRYGLNQRPYDSIIRGTSEFVDANLEKNVTTENFLQKLQNFAYDYEKKNPLFTREKFVSDWYDLYQDMLSEKLYQKDSRFNYAKSKESKDTQALFELMQRSEAINSGNKAINNEPGQVPQTGYEAQLENTIGNVPIIEQFYFQSQSQGYASLAQDFFNFIEQGRLPVIPQYDEDESEPEDEEDVKEEEEKQMNNYKEEMLDGLKDINNKASDFKKILNQINQLGIENIKQVQIFEAGDLNMIKSVLSPEVLEYTMSLVEKIDLERYNYQSYDLKFAMTPEERKNKTMEILAEVLEKTLESVTKNPKIWILKKMLDTSEGDKGDIFARFLGLESKQELYGEGKSKMKGAGTRTRFRGQLAPVQANDYNKKERKSEYRTPRPAPSVKSARISQPVSKYTVGNNEYFTVY